MPSPSAHHIVPTHPRGSMVLRQGVQHRGTILSIFGGCFGCWQICFARGNIHEWVNMVDGRMEWWIGGWFEKWMNRFMDGWMDGLRDE